jgi:hypothetical protein
MSLEADPFGRAMATEVSQSVNNVSNLSWAELMSWLELTTS